MSVLHKILTQIDAKLGSMIHPNTVQFLGTAAQHAVEMLATFRMMCQMSQDAAINEQLDEWLQRYNNANEKAVFCSELYHKLDFSVWSMHGRNIIDTYCRDHSILLNK